jgi:hypothetical protein
MLTLNAKSMRFQVLSAIPAIFAVGLQATTLQQLTMDDMIAQSTAIVHVKVTSAAPVMRGRNIYTFYQFQTIETLKGTASAQVAVPGGAISGVRQDVAGAPSLRTGGEYVIFLWTSNSGLTQVIGLSQGLFNVAQDSSGSVVLVRAALMGATTVNQSGQVQNASAVTISLAALKSEIQKVSGAAN